MTTYYLNGTKIVEGSDITLNGFTYPYTWLEGTSQSLRASLGIEKTGDVMFDSKHYITEGNAKHLEDREEVDVDNNPLFVKVWDPEAESYDGNGAMVDSNERLISKGLKTTCTSEVKAITNPLLSPTDYYIIRNEAEQSEIPESVVTYRAAVIAEQERVTAAISTVTNVEELIEIMNSITWPIIAG